MDSTIYEAVGIFKLNDDVFHYIFSINSLSSSYDGKQYFLGGPVETTRNCSQVCALWRGIILNSTSIWANCIDIDDLQQDGDEWRNEILRRTGNASLSVYSEDGVDVDTKGHSFLLDLLQNHWYRMKVLQITFNSLEAINDLAIWGAFGSPAPHLQTFFICVNNSEGTEVQTNILHPIGFRLFSGYAPLITEFYISSMQHAVPVLFKIPLIPQFLVTPRLRVLQLCQAAELFPDDVFVACKQMPNLVELGVILKSSPSLFAGCIELARLEKIRVISRSLDTFSDFVGRINTQLGCVLDCTIWRDQIEGQPHATTARDLIGFRRILWHYATCVFERCRDGQTAVQRVELSFLPQVLSCQLFQRPHNTRFILSPRSDDEMLLYAILTGTIDIFSSFRFSNTISELDLSLFEISDNYRDIGDGNLQYSGDHSAIYTSLGRIFSFLDSVTVLEVGMDTLKSLVKIWELQLTKTLFPWLEVIYPIRPSKEDDFHFLGPFLSRPKAIRRYESLDFTLSCYKGHALELGDLRYLEDFLGLKVDWIQDDKLVEYVCGTGRPEVLLWWAI
ncbi:hypothetical protein BDN70DRAFT_936070 [Pholiota conissans]|uniref:F-box domain-containing protein n=1 Tax=Pholiota conissans TaxID=109636 RepID=A0A9P5YSS4_9AGAR|nr:hypothetical protein BDN70DRAFT_936070 [Pholiota conissans]